MASRMNTILIVGATNGIGEAIARRFHAMGKKVIITGRRQEKLDTMKKELNGLETRQVGSHSLPALRCGLVIIPSPRSKSMDIGL